MLDNLYEINGFVVPFLPSDSLVNRLIRWLRCFILTIVGFSSLPFLCVEGEHSDPDSYVLWSISHGQFLFIASLSTDKERVGVLFMVRGYFAHPLC